MYKGPTGSGKTSRLLEKYREIAYRKGTGICLAFVKNAGSVKDWRKRVELETMGLLNIYTYFGFVQKELSDYWPWIETKLPGGLTRVEPTFMNVETAHYLMSKYVEKHRMGRDVFEYINATSPRIAVQLIDNLNQAAMNNLSLNELEERLLNWAADDREKTMVFNEAVEIMRAFRNFSIDKRLLDYSLMIDFYNNYLFENEEYQRELTERYNYFFVDNLEKAVPAAQQLFLFLFENTEESYLSYNPEETINKFFGGNPELARELFFPLCKVHEL
ncbi:MAG TPA: UvrD-helicase domain-containing protein, partial [Halanaerobiales bacterium]|nr:UvrD-helicase domain-containing protein [Halanaerobiales bacterium]